MLVSDPNRRGNVMKEGSRSLGELDTGALRCQTSLTDHHRLSIRLRAVVEGEEGRKVGNFGVFAPSAMMRPWTGRAP